MFAEYRPTVCEEKVLQVDASFAASTASLMLAHHPAIMCLN
jgi:hypothetical protein